MITERPASALLDAVHPRSANPHFFPEQLSEPGVELWAPQHLWLFDTQEPDGRVGIAATLDRKLQALDAHASEQGGAGGLTKVAKGISLHLGGGDVPAEAFRMHRPAEV